MWIDQDGKSELGNSSQDDMSSFPFVQRLKVVESETDGLDKVTKLVLRLNFHKDPYTIIDALDQIDVTQEKCFNFELSLFIEPNEVIEEVDENGTFWGQMEAETRNENKRNKNPVVRVDWNG
jgi:hypothetical protein